ncbi:hypothetical protein EV121DRAFT_274862, partial [Schizophyllum commune]
HLAGKTALPRGPPFRDSTGGFRWPTGERRKIVCIYIAAFDPNVISVSLSSYSHHATSTTSEASAVVLAPMTISASSELVIADGELAPDLASTTRTTFPTPTTPTHSPFPHRPRRRRGHYPRSTLAVTRGRNFVDIGNILRYWVHNYRLTRHLKQRAAVLIDARAFPVRAPSTTSRRDSQAWETGGSVLGATARSWGEELGPLLAMTNESGHRDRREFSASSTSRYAVFSCDSEPPEARVRTPRAKDAK